MEPNLNEVFWYISHSIVWKLRSTDWKSNLLGEKLGILPSSKSNNKWVNIHLAPCKDQNTQEVNTGAQTDWLILNCFVGFSFFSLIRILNVETAYTPKN